MGSIKFCFGQRDWHDCFAEAAFLGGNCFVQGSAFQGLVETKDRGKRIRDSDG